MRNFIVEGEQAIRRRRNRGQTIILIDLYFEKDRESPGTYASHVEDDSDRAVAVHRQIPRLKEAQFIEEEQVKKISR